MNLLESNASHVYRASYRTTSSTQSNTYSKSNRKNKTIFYVCYYCPAIKRFRQWWCTPLIPALGRQRPVDLCEFEVSLVYRANFRTSSKATEKPCLKKSSHSVCMLPTQSGVVEPHWPSSISNCTKLSHSQSCLSLGELASHSWNKWRFSWKLAVSSWLP